MSDLKTRVIVREEKSMERYERLLKAIDYFSSGKKTEFFKYQPKHEKNNTITEKECKKALTQFYNFQKVLQKTLSDAFFITIKKLHPELNINWVLEGTGIMNSSNHETIPHYDMAKNSTKEIQLLNEEPQDYDIKLPPLAGCDLSIRLNVTNVPEDFKRGDMIVIKMIEGRKIFAYGEPFLIKTKDYYFLKYIHKSSEKGCVCISKFKDPNSEDCVDMEIKEIEYLYIIKGSWRVNTL